MVDSHKVVIVESDVEFCEQMVNQLSIHYEVRVASDLNCARDLIETHRPHIVLLDTYLNNQSTVDFYVGLKSLESYQDFAVVFITENTSLDERLKAYEVGASEVLVRPFDYEELTAKLQVIDSYLIEKRKLIIECEEAKSASTEFMKEASQHGLVVQFFRNLSYCQHIEQLSFTVFQATNALNLHASMVVRDEQDHYFDSKTGVVNPIERNIFDLLHTKGRVFQFGNRLIFNDKHTAILIKNLPEDERLVGQIRDIYAFVVEGLEAKFQDIRRQNMLLDIVKDIANTAQQVSHRINQFDDISAENLSESNQELNDSYHFLGLSYEQEEALSALFESGLKRMEFAKGDLANMQKMLEDLVYKIENTEMLTMPSEETPSQDASGDVELF
ncbi:response regulator [uncultured Vibrio sp.]|uniref:response regulator n=1 Tax=uncultured Vibrio sp. TaxID=114054 RepID=UPI0025E822D1|nr:response regulator [uncultured Vibrio sp.]